MTSAKVLGETQQGENKWGNLCEKGEQERPPDPVIQDLEDLKKLAMQRSGARHYR